MSHSTTQIRQFLMNAFNDEELKTLCFDYFPSVYENFGSAMTKGEKVLLLIGYCQRHERIADLIGALKRERPGPFVAAFSSLQEDPSFERTQSPPVRKPRKVLISCAHEDAKIAHRLAEILEANRWRVWIAQNNIMPGEKWIEAINRGLAECSKFVLILTEAAIKSRWVRSETNVAIELDHEGVMQFIPLEVEPCQLPPIWKTYQRIPVDIDNKPTLRPLFSALAGSHGKTKMLVKEHKRDVLITGPNFTVQQKSVSRLYWVGIIFVPMLSLLIWTLIWFGRDPIKPPINAELHDTWTRLQEKDGMEMVYVPAGTFMMGSKEDDVDEKRTEFPPHAVTLDAFWIDKTEVTNTQFEAFATQTGYETTAEKEGRGFTVYTNGKFELVDGANWQSPQGPDSVLDGIYDHPVVLVSWTDANEYCTWVGGQLPTAAQWEYAARGEDSSFYPWGNEFDGSKLNYCDDNCDFGHQDTEQNDGYAMTAPVGSYPEGASWVGALDMVGNVREWMGNVWCDNYFNFAQCGFTTPDRGEQAEMRGGSWYSRQESLRSATRRTQSLDNTYSTYGFRCIIDPEK